MESENKKRSNVQDMVKGALIIAVVFFHSTLFVNPTSYLEFNIVFCLFPYIMGVFFIYSGYNYTVGKRKPIDNIKRRAKQLLIPLLVMIVVDAVLVGGLQLLYNATDWTGIWHSFKKLLLSEGGIAHWNPDLSHLNFELGLSFGVLWYLYALFIISVIFYLIVDKVIIKRSRFIPIVVMLVTLSFVIGQFVSPILPYAIQSYPLMLAMMLTGAYLSQKKVLDRPIESKKSIVLTVVQTVVAEGVIVGIGLLCYYCFGASNVGAFAGGALNSVIKGFDAFVVYIMAILGTFFAHNVMRLLGKVKIFSVFFGFIGKRVAIVYVTHPIFLSYIHTIIFGKDFSVLGGFQPYAYTGITLILFIGSSLLVGFLSRKNAKGTKEVNNEN